MGNRLLAIEKPIVGVVHLAPLPGAPAWRPPFEAILERARADALALSDGGVDAVLVENYGDAPFLPGPVGPETVASMAVLIHEVRRAVDLPVGVNVLRSDPRSALGLAVSTGGDFLRVNVHTGAAVTDQGLLQGTAHETLRERARLGAADVAILADVHVKHARPLVDMPIDEAARDAVERGRADAVLVTGARTGSGADLEDVRIVKAAVEVPVFVASGVTEDTVRETLAVADGVIVASSLLSTSGDGPSIDVERVRAFVAAARRG